MNKLRTAVLAGCIGILLFCGLYLHQLFALSGMSKVCILLFVVFSFASESLFRYLTILVDLIRKGYCKIRGTVKQ